MTIASYHSLYVAFLLCGRNIDLPTVFESTANSFFWNKFPIIKLMVTGTSNLQMHNNAPMIHVYRYMPIFGEFNLCGVRATANITKMLCYAVLYCNVLREEPVIRLASEVTLLRCDNFGKLAETQSGLS